MFLLLLLVLLLVLLRPLQLGCMEPASPRDLLLRTPGQTLTGGPVIHEMGQNGLSQGGKLSATCLTQP